MKGLSDTDKLLLTKNSLSYKYVYLLLKQIVIQKKQLLSCCMYDGRDLTLGRLSGRQYRLSTRDIYIAYN